jgi:hypothetical protein
MFKDEFIDEECPAIEVMDIIRQKQVDLIDEMRKYIYNTQIS